MHLILLFSINLCISLLKHAQGLVKFTCACAFAGIAVCTLLSELCKVQGLQSRSVKAQTHSACEEAPSSLALLEGRHCLILQGRHCFVLQALLEDRHCFVGKQALLDTTGQALLCWRAGTACTVAD